MPGKFKIVVSDLHLGAGFVAEGNLLEDFDKDREFSGFLDKLAAESDRKVAEVELILNGDILEMLQVPHAGAFDPACAYPPELYHSSSELDSERKMKLIIAGHPVFFDALRSFIQAGPPPRYLTFVKGNHDLNLHWPAVQRVIRQAVGATRQRATLLIFEERRVSREGIYVEHGNQYATIVDRVPDMEEPKDPKNPGQLSLPVGSWFVMDVFNDVEREKYWVDGVKPIPALVWYALAYDFPFAVRAAAKLLRALPGILVEVARDAEEPGLAEAQQDLLRRLEDPGAVEKMAARYQADEVYRAEFNAELATVLSLPPELERGAAMPMTHLPSAVAMGDQVRGQVNTGLFEAAKKLAAEAGARVVVFGHTHDAGEEPLPGGGCYFNSGTWTWRADFSAAGEQTWRELFEYPERFTGLRLLSYVRIDYDHAGQPAGRLLAYKPSKASGPDGDEGESGSRASLWDRFLTWIRGL